MGLFPNCRLAFLVLVLLSSACADEAQLCDYSQDLGFASHCSSIVGTDSIRLNEFSSNGDDHIEVMNTSDSVVDIGTWILTDDVKAQRIDDYDPRGDDEKFVFPKGAVIPSGGYVVIPKGAGELLHSFGISKNGEVVSLIAPNGTLVDQAQSTKGVAQPSFCRIPDGHGEWQTCEETFGSSNLAVKCGDGVKDDLEQCDGSDLGGLSCSDVSSAFTGGTLSCSSSCNLDRSRCETNAPCDAETVVLNEVCHKNTECGVAGVTKGDWLEIYNSSESEASLGGCSIRVVKSGEIQLETKFAWVAGYEALVVPPRGFVLIDDVEDLFKAGRAEDVVLVDVDNEPINSLTTSTALSVDGDLTSSMCTIGQSSNTPTPGQPNACGL